MDGARYQLPARPLLWLMRLLTAAALIVSAVLLVESMRGSGLPGCGQGSGCDQVLNSPWAKVGPVPVSAAAIVLYAAMVVLLFCVKRRWAWALLLIGAAAAAGAAGWFTYVQVAQVGAWCKYCLTVHVCGVMAAALIGLTAPIGRASLLPGDPPDAMMIGPGAAVGLAAVGLIGAAALAAVQVAYPAPTTRVTLLEGSMAVELDIRRMPMLGDPTAPVILAEFFDYTCPHCQNLNGHLHEARQRYGDQLAVLLLPTPLDSDCNPFLRTTEPVHENACTYARLALAVWRVRPELFETYHQWLFDHQEELTIATAVDQAVALVGEAALDEPLSDPRMDERIAVNCQMFGVIGGGLPKLLYKNIRIEGRPANAAELFELLEANTPLRP